jgi:hypothetical protein
MSARSRRPLLILLIKGICVNIFSFYRTSKAGDACCNCLIDHSTVTIITTEMPSSARAGYNLRTNFRQEKPRNSKGKRLHFLVFLWPIRWFSMGYAESE